MKPAASMLHSLARRLLPAAVMLMLLLQSTAASAHAELIQAQPQPNAALEGPPRQITLAFSEPLNRKLSSISLTDAQGNPVTFHELTFSERDPAVMTLDLPRNARPGVYTVQWTSVSAVDGHILRGSYVLFAGVPARDFADTSLQAAARPDAGPVSMAVRWLAWIGLAAWMGAAFWSSFILDPKRLSRASWEAHLQSWLRYAPLLVLTGWLLELCLQAYTLSGGNWVNLFSRSTWQGLLFSGSSGYAQAVRLLLVASALPAAGKISSARIELLLCSLALLATAAAGHAATVTSVPLSAVLFDALHLIAALVWTGGILVAGWIVLPLFFGRSSTAAGANSTIASREELFTLLRRFSPWAFGGFLVMLLTGWLNTELQVGSLDALFGTVYGRLLQVKLGLVALLLLFSALHVFRLRSRVEASGTNGPPAGRWRLLMRLQPWIVLAVFGTVSVLTTYPPARTAWEARLETVGVPAPVPGAIRLEDAAGPYRLRLSLYPHEIGPNTLEVQVSDVLDRPVEDALVRFRLQGPVEESGRAFVTTEARGRGTYRGYGSFTRAGRWQIETIVRLPGDANEYRSMVSLDIPVPDAAVLIEEADRAMNALSYLHARNELGPGLNGTEVTEIDYAAPDRVYYVRSRTGAETLGIGDTRYDRLTGEDTWMKMSWPAAEPLSWPAFDWSDNVSDTVILGEETVRGVETWVVGFHTPVYDASYRLWIGKRDYRVYRERMIAPGHYMSTEYSSFDIPVSIEAPAPQDVRDIGG